MADSATNRQQYKEGCPNCGSSEIFYNIEGGVFECKFCHNTFEPGQVRPEFDNSIEDVKQLSGTLLSPGMKTTQGTQREVFAFQCPSCGATMSMDPATDTTTIKCHWCRTLLTTANRITNGIIPDAIIPFTVPKAQAEVSIQEYLNKRKFFADPEFIRTFTPDMVYPVYFPYIVLDLKADVEVAGEAAIRKRKHDGGKNNRDTYDYDVYNFGRKFNLDVNNLLVEGNSSFIIKPGENYRENSKNIINSILPYDLKRAVAYDPKFLNGGYRAEFRDLNVEDIQPVVRNQVVDISRYNAVETMKQYTHGYQFKQDEANITGSKYESILAPIWLYSYQDRTGKLNYICVNGQTGETAACIPVNKRKLMAVTLAIELPIALLCILLSVSIWMW
ncbi:MAG TPA: hypothetical protein DEB31_04185 [Clostridiales bacterium]|nr:hypothetical protein [Clostridiales bacterium]